MTKRHLHEGNDTSKSTRAPLVILLGAAILALTLALWPSKVTFQVTLTTEGLTFHTSRQASSRWPLRGATILDGESVVLNDTSGSLALNPHVDVTLQRMGTGPLLIQCTAADNHSAVGVLYDSSDTIIRTLGQYVVIKFADIAARVGRGETIVLPITGHVEFGRALGFETDAAIPLLRSGTVALLGHSLIGDSAFDAGTYALAAGDSFAIASDGDADGFVAVNETAALSGVFRQASVYGHVSRFGGMGYDIGVSLLERVRYDKEVQLVWGAGAALIGAWLAFVKWWSPS